ncbi:MAG: acyl-CoA thioesterase [Promethearchaeati archaeon]
MDEIKKRFPVFIKIPVLWGQMDAFQHLNNVLYFRFFESVRITYFKKIGFLKYMEEKDIGPILASTNCKYLKQIKYPDTLIMGAKVPEIKEDRFLMEYVMGSMQKNTIVAIGEADVVCYNYKLNKKEKLPEEIKDKIIKLEKKLS